MDVPETLGARLRGAAGAGVTWVDDGPCSWLLVHVETPEAVAGLVSRAVPLLAEDAVFWVAHPRGGPTGLSRERGWEPLVREGFGAMECVPLDDHRQALRFVHQHDTHLRHGGVSRP
jgi:hypothetical protein